VDRPWQAFVCAAVGGAGFGIANTANQVLSLTLVSAEQRASSIALGRVAGNFGFGSGATVAGFVIAAADNLRAFPVALPLRRRHLRCLRAGCARGDPESSPCEGRGGERQGNRLPGSCHDRSSSS